MRSGCSFHTDVPKQIFFFSAFPIAFVCLLTGCSVEEALEAASLHPAQLLGISHKKGNLNYDSDAGQDSTQQSSALHFINTDFCPILVVFISQDSHIIHTTLLQTLLCSMMISTSKPPTFLDRRFGEKKKRTTPAAGNWPDQPSGDAVYHRPQNQRFCVEWFNSS